MARGPTLLIFLFHLNGEIVVTVDFPIFLKTKAVMQQFTKSVVKTLKNELRKQ